jgi:hypothetical protein
MLHRLGDGDVPAAGADGGDQLDFVVVVAGLRRVRRIGALDHERIGGFGKEERRFGIGIMPHLARMLGIVAAPRNRCGGPERALRRRRGRQAAAAAR